MKRGPEINEFSDVIYFLCVILWGAILAVPVLIYAGYVMSNMWAAFIYPLAPEILARNISVAHALGLMIVFMMPFRRILMDLRQFLSDQEDPEDVYTIGAVTANAVTGALLLTWLQAVAGAFEYFM